MSNVNLSVKGLSKSYDRPILTNLDLDITAGTMHCILGMSGTGKSTLLSILAGLLPPDEGQVYFNNIPISDIPEDQIRVNYVGIIFQKYQMFDHMTAIDNIQSAANFNVKEINHDMIEKLATQLKVVEHLNKYPNQLSGGQKQRIGIIRALINLPDIILADEPTGSLDTKNSNEIMNILTEISASGKIVLLSTHDLSVANYADKISILKNGHLIPIDKEILSEVNSIRQLYIPDHQLV